jgi:hypothetical protein
MAAAKPAMATSPRINSLQPHRIERYRIFTVKLFQEDIDKSHIKSEFWCKIRIRRSSSGTKVIGARLFRAFGWITAITPAARLNPSRVTDRAPSLPQGTLLS